MGLRTVLRAAIALVFLVLNACGGGGSGSNESGPGGSTPAPSGIGPAGGTVDGPSGAQVVIPAGALSQHTDIVIARSSTGAPPLPEGVIAVGEMFAFTPHGTTFASPVIVTVPFDPEQVPAGETPLLLKTDADQTGWEAIEGAAIDGSVMCGSVSSFSWILVSRIPPPPPPVDVTDEPQRYHEFIGYDLDGVARHISGNLDLAWQPIDAVHPPGELLVTEQFGPLTLAPPGGDELADGEVFSSADGRTYWVQAEAPTGDLLAQDPDKTFLGSESRLLIAQSYRKHASNATLELVITRANMHVADYGSAARLGGCPWTGAAENTLEDCNDLLSAELAMSAFVLEGSERDRAELKVRGRRVHQIVEGSAFLTHVPDPDARFRVYGTDTKNNARLDSLWADGHFETLSSAHETKVSLPETLRVPIDLSEVPECLTPITPESCPEFTLETTVLARTHNRRAGETFAVAYLRDPLNIDGVELVATGLTPTNRPLLDEIGEIPLIELEPECTSGADPDAGELELNASSYRIMEFGSLHPQIFVVRRGGSRGEVAATVTSNDGTAIADTHYSAIAQTVIFKDGQTTPRAITLPIIDNTDNDGNVTLQLALNAEPGCAALGDRVTAEVTIIDDEATGAPQGPSGTLDETFGIEGRVNTAPFGGEQSDMAVQPDGKIVMAGGAFTGFVLARFNPDGSPDTDFGTGGQVTTEIEGIAPRARAVAVQSDGKIVAAGETQLAGDMVVALVRYNADGSRDSSFGESGRVLAPVNGRAFAVAVLDDARIVIAGDAPVDRANDFGDLLIARFDADGTLDTTFGDAGQRVLDVGARTNLARDLALYPDGSIVVAGDPFGSNADDRTAVARLDANGDLDGDFGTGGIVSIDERVGRGLALQPDGKLLLVGASSVVATSHFATMRLNADGSLDSTFGTNGIVTTSVSNSANGAGDIAYAVAVHVDGRIYVAGVSGSLNQNFGLLRYTATGTLDTTFAAGGILAIDFNGLSDGAENIALLGAGRVLLGGFATPAASDGYGLARVLP